MAASKRESVELWLNRSSETPTTPDFDLASLARRLDLDDSLDSVTAGFLNGVHDNEDETTSSSSSSGESISPNSAGVATEAGSSGTDSSVHRLASQESQLPYLAADDEDPSKSLGVQAPLSPNALFTASPVGWPSNPMSPLGAPFGWSDSTSAGVRPPSPLATRHDRSPIRSTRPRLGPHRSSMNGIPSAHRRSQSYARQMPATPPLDPVDIANTPLAPDLALSLHDLGVSVVDSVRPRPSSTYTSASCSPTATPPLASTSSFGSANLRSPISPIRPVLGRTNSGRNNPIARRRSAARTSAAAGTNILNAVLPKRRAIAVDAAELLQVAEAGAGLSPTQSPTTPRPGKAMMPSVPLIVDVRPLPTYLEKHIRGSASANFPSLLMKRFRKGSTSAFNLESFLTTEASKEAYHRAIRAAGGLPGSLDGLDIYVVDDHIQERAADTLTTGSSTGDILCSVLERLRDGDFSKGAVYYLKGSFSALSNEDLAARLLVSDAEEAQERQRATPPPRSSSHSSPSSSSLTTSPASSVSSGSPVTNRRQGLLALQQSPVVRQPAQQGAPLRGPPGGLKICTSPTTPTASSSSASPGSGSSSASARRARLKRLDTGDGLRVGSNEGARSGARSPRPLQLGAAAHGHPGGLTIQALAHVQSKSPIAPTFDFGSGSSGHRHNDSTTSNATIREPATPHPGGGGGGDNTGDVAFSVSTIIPGVLYLGSEPAREEEVKQLEALGVQRILNMAVELPDRPELELAKRFQRVERLPMRDFVEEQNVQTRIDEACAFLDDAGLHSKPVYVHCRAGKSRSVMIVLAYLIHRFRWPLKRAYAHVSERRPTASPNLGFVAELLRYEERELGVVKASTLGSSVPAPGSMLSSRTPEVPSSGSIANSRVRESLPPAPAWQRAGEREAEQEVKGSGGIWQFAHRPPVDADFMPSRRASKAGLESGFTR